ncbi:alpha-2-macroglobulin family protein [Aureibaculum luteum]|uniref:alpha-2-macroglobulin family protein n=1 Tax=Aureibaculum luteum TaxID=1548456 RepID=UPI000E481464|nr:MG2 domain-containing protein [Aureibaculum luteum]
MKFLKRIFSLFLLLIIVISCKKENPQEDTDNLFKFKDYIYYTTSGVVSVTESLQIGLAKEVEGWEPDKEISEDLITISPAVKGKLKALNSRTFVFNPEENLKPDTEYTINVNLSKMYLNLPSEFKEYTFKFKTIKPNFALNTNNLQSYSKEWQYIEGVLRSADVIPLEMVEKLVSVTQNGKPLSIKWLPVSQNSSVYQFKIDSIQRLKDDSEIDIKWSGKDVGIDNVGEAKRVIPGISNFSIVNADVIQSPEQHLALNFSDPIKKQQNFKGLVAIAGAQNLKYVVDGNVLKVYPGTRLKGNVQVDVFSGITNVYGFKFKKKFSEQIAFEELKPAVKLMSNGVILPDSKNLQLNFEAVNLKAVDIRVIKIFENNILQFLQEENLNGINSYSIRRVGRRVAKQTMTLIKSDIENDGKWKTYAVDLSKMIKTDPGAIYRIELSFTQEYALNNCDGSQLVTNVETEDYDAYFEDDDYDDTNLAEDELEEREEQYWDNLIYNYKNHRYYNWEDRENPCKEAYYFNENNIATANVMATNLGVIAKKGVDKSYHFAVTDILTTTPISGAKIELFNFQQQEIGTVNTDSQGFALYKAEKNAHFAVVSHAGQKTYLKLNDGYSLSLSKFDVSGKQLQKGLKGYIYGERGVWRPGDSIHLTFMLNDVANPLPKNHPVKLEITDPHGKLTHKLIDTDGKNGFHKFTVVTDETAATGNWNAKISVGGANFYKALKVETVKPNRLKIAIDFEDEILTANTPIDGKLSVKWLHGADAKNLKADVKVKFTSTSTAFDKYPNYVFSDPTRKFTPEEVTVFDGKLDAEGNANLTKKLSFNSKAPGMLRASFLTRAFENGGDFSIDVISKNFAPYDAFVGLQSPEAKAYGSYFTDEDVEFDLVTVNNQGNPIAKKGVQVKVYKVEWRWWWNSSYDDLASYVGSQYHKPILTKVINTSANGKGTFKINVPDEEGGRYLIRVYDPESGHATGRTAYFYKDWWKRPAGSDASGATMLVFSSDKTDYNVGEKAKITFPSGTVGRALISIENGTEVIDQRWIKTQKGETTTEIDITKEMAPNVFVNISLLQPHASTANDLPIRMYGVIPLMVKDPNTILEPQISMPKVLKPEEKFTVKVSEKQGKPMTYTLAVVDDGLLDLTRFNTPNAWDEFYSKEALGVKTWDIFDYVIGAYGGTIAQIFAIGGDEDAGPKKPKKANRFKPVVTYLGPFTLDKGKTASHEIQMPKYIGSVRTMVIAGDNSKEAYGSASETTPVRKPLMVLSSLPRKLSPGEKVTLPVTIFAMEDKVKRANISLKLSDGITIVGEQTQSVTFDKPDEKMVYFELDVSKAQGIGTIEVLASGNGEKSSYKVEIDVVNPNPISSRSTQVVLEPNASQNIDFTSFGVPGTSFAQVEFSTLPPMDFTRRLQYLIRYPHGCVEQTTSSGFPQLYLTDILDLTFDKKQEIDNNIKKTVERLGRYQTPSGGLSYWMGQNNANDWGTSYAGHFMLEAQKKGYVMPLTFMNNWLKYQQEAARNWRANARRYNTDLAQAYRLYTLALAGHADLGSMNRLREYNQLSNDAKWRLAAAYALAGQKEVAKKIAQTANIHFESNTYDYYTYGSTNRNRAMAMETMLLTDNPKSREMSEYLAKELSADRWMSTQTTAYSLLAMSKMVEIGGGKDLNVEFSNNGTKSDAVSTKKSIAQRKLKIVDGANSLKVTNKKANTVYVTVLNSGILPLGEEMVEKRNLSVQVVYKDTGGRRIDITKLAQGTDFTATVTVSNLKYEYVANIALTEIFPSGWEIINTRFTDYGNSTTSQANFTDIRDDRVNFYFDLERQKTKTFTVQLNASYLGKYYLPGIQAEAMYDNDYFVRDKGQWIQVIK